MTSQAVVIIRNIPKEIHRTARTSVGNSVWVNLE